MRGDCANDVVNPAAHEDPNSPIYGMPIIEVERARTVIVLKRSLAAASAGIENLSSTKTTPACVWRRQCPLQALVSEFRRRLTGTTERSPFRALGHPHLNLNTRVSAKADQVIGPVGRMGVVAEGRRTSWRSPAT